MEIQRDTYLDELLRKRGNGLIKVITGLRRCGKSYLLRKMFKERLLSMGLPGSIFVEVAFDERDNRHLCHPDAFYDFAKERLVQQPGSIFLLDEIQFLPDFESVLNGLLGRGAEIYVTGSNARFLSREVITEFRGRGDEVHVWPLSFEEIWNFFRDDKTARLQEYMLYGGLPPVVLAATPADKMALLDSLYSETYLRDIVGRHKIRKSAELSDLMDVLSSNIGSLTNPERLQRIFHSVKKSPITAVTIHKYLEYLEEAYLIEHSMRYDVRGNSYIESPRKYYFTDLGLRNSRLSFRQFEEPYSMENLIYNELRRRKFKVDVGVVATKEKNSAEVFQNKQLEVDFVVNQGSRRYYIQSAYMIPDVEKRTQETRPLRKISDSFRKIIITAHAPEPWYDNDGILTISLYDFLLNPSSLDT